jgi:hypothetical protein
MLSLLFRSGARQSQRGRTHSSVDADSPVVFQLEMSRVIVHRSEWLHSSQTKDKTQAPDFYVKECCPRKLPRHEDTKTEDEFLTL